MAADLQFSPRELSFIEIALETQIRNNDLFHQKVDAGEMPGYDADTLQIGKDHNRERKAILEKIKQAQIG